MTRRRSLPAAVVVGQTTCDICWHDFSSIARRTLAVSHEIQVSILFHVIVVPTEDKNKCMRGRWLVIDEVWMKNTLRSRQEWSGFSRCLSSLSSLKIFKENEKKQPTASKGLNESRERKEEVTWEGRPTRETRRTWSKRISCTRQDHLLLLVVVLEGEKRRPGNKEREENPTRYSSHVRHAHLFFRTRSLSCAQLYGMHLTFHAFCH